MDACYCVKVSADLLSECLADGYRDYRPGAAERVGCIRYRLAPAPWQILRDTVPCVSDGYEPSPCVDLVVRLQQAGQTAQARAEPREANASDGAADVVLARVPLVCREERSSL